MSFHLTIDLDVGGFPVGTSPTDIAKAITSCYPNHESMRVVSIQQCPKKVARVTFDKRDGWVNFLEAKEFRMVGEFQGIKCRVIPSPVPPTPWSTVVVYNYPYEFPNELVESVMSGYGEVGGVRFQSWVGFPGVSTGTRLVRMHRKRRIPRFLYIGNFRCKVWYKASRSFATSVMLRVTLQGRARLRVNVVCVLSLVIWPGLALSSITVVGVVILVLSALKSGAIALCLLLRRVLMTLIIPH